MKLCQVSSRPEPIVSALNDGLFKVKHFGQIGLLSLSCLKMGEVEISGKSPKGRTKEASDLSRSLYRDSQGE